MQIRLSELLIKMKSHDENSKEDSAAATSVISQIQPQLNYEMGIPRKVLPVKYWGCRPVEIYEKIKIVGKGTFG